MANRKIDYTKEFLGISKSFFQVSVEANNIMRDMKETIKKINDQNILHHQKTEDCFINQEGKIDKLTVNLKDYQDFIIKQLMGVGVFAFKMIIIALIILAGVKAAEATGLFKILGLML